MKTILEITGDSKGKINFESDFNPFKADNLIGKAFISLYIDCDRQKSEQVHNAINLLALTENAVCVNSEVSRKHFFTLLKRMRPGMYAALRKIEDNARSRMATA